MMADTAWKAFERWVCRVFGGFRDWQNPEECAETGLFAPEAKRRKKLPAWLVGMMTQAEDQAREDQIGVVVLTQHQWKREDSLAIMRVKDLLWIREQLPEDARPVGASSEEDPFEGADLFTG